MLIIPTSIYRVYRIYTQRTEFRLGKEAEVGLRMA